jgi:hypothetical protein
MEAWAIAAHPPADRDPLCTGVRRPTMASRGVHFVDTAGNMFLRWPGLLVDVRGRRGSTAAYTQPRGNPVRAFSYPKLTLARFDSPDPNWWRSANDAVLASGAQWGGERRRTSWTSTCVPCQWPSRSPRWWPSRSPPPLRLISSSSDSSWVVRASRIRYYSLLVDHGGGGVVSCGPLKPPWCDVPEMATCTSRKVGQTRLGKQGLARGSTG